MNYNTPLYDALKAYSKKNMIPFHMPGHKLGAGFPEQFRDSFLDIDLTELPDTDDLHAPEGPIEEAQKLAAEAFGARQTFFLVNGSTCGIQTMIAGVCNPGDILIVDRNCHLSVIHSLILCGVIPQYIYPEYISDLDFIGGINPHEVEEALKKHPDAKGVFITCPTYHGICSDIKTIADIVHRYDKMLLVDEAHGAHFCFHPNLPQGALHAGADICVQSAHKTLPALTQSALLHVNSFNIDLQRIKRCLKIFQSSSPSFVLMAYLDVCRSIMQSNGNQLLEDLIQWSAQARNIMNEENRLYCLGQEMNGRYSIHSVDITRMVVNFSHIELTGYQVEKELYARDGIQIEMSDLNSIVSIASIGNTKEQFLNFAQAVKKIALKARVKRHGTINQYIMPRSVMKPADAFYSRNKLVGLRDAVGGICTAVIASYPPGVPVLCPGELITEEIINYVMKIKSMGGKITGLENGTYIRIKNL